MTPHRIPCPACGHAIVIDAKRLIAGDQFGCAGCGARIGLPRTSVATVASALDQLDAARKSVGVPTDR